MVSRLHAVNALFAWQVRRAIYKKLSDEQYLCNQLNFGIFRELLPTLPNKFTADAQKQCCQMWGIFPKVGIFGDGVGIEFFKWGLALKVWGFRL